MHGDEAVQCDIVRRLLEDNKYEYDKNEYHGPTLPYIAREVLRFFKISSFAASTEMHYRIIPLAFCIAMILLLALVADGIGKTGAIVAGPCRCSSYRTSSAPAW